MFSAPPRPLPVTTAYRGIIAQEAGASAPVWLRPDYIAYASAIAAHDVAAAEMN